MAVRSAIVAVSVVAVLGALVGCTQGGSSRQANQVGSSTTTGTSAATTSGATSGPVSLTPSSSVSATKTSHASGSTKKPTSSISSAHGPRTVPLDGTNPSGVICSYVTQPQVNAILPGASTGQENDIDSVAVSYCNFTVSPYGSVAVGVKNMGTAPSAVGKVHEKYNVMSAEPDQTKHTFTINGEFAFEISSTTPLNNGVTLYAVNAQGSRGAWYVSIQYYAHRSCSASAMQHLIEQVLAEVP